MTQRPRSVTFIGVLFIVVGLISVGYHATEFRAHGPFQFDLLAVLLVRLIALICGVFILRASNWARWLLLVWLAFHVVISALHSISALIVHGALLGVLAYFLFRPTASAYFRKHEIAVQAPNASPH